MVAAFGTLVASAVFAQSALATELPVNPSPAVNTAAQTVTQPVEQATQPAAAVVEQAPVPAPAPAPAPDTGTVVEAAANAAAPAAPVTRTVESAVAPVASTVQQAAAPVAKTVVRTVEAATPVVSSTANVVDGAAAAVAVRGAAGSTGGPRGSDFEAQSAPTAFTPTSDPRPGTAASGPGSAAAPNKRSAPTPLLLSGAPTIVIDRLDLSAATAAAERLLPTQQRRATRAPAAPGGDPPNDQPLLGSPSSAGASPGGLFAAFAVLATLMSLAIPPLGRRLSLSPALAPPGMFASPLEHPG